jgi:ribosomal protein S27AE
MNFPCPTLRISTVLYIGGPRKLVDVAVVDSGEKCPNCGTMLGKNGSPVKDKVAHDVNGKPGVKFTCPKCGASLFSSSPQVINDTRRG